MLIFGRVTESGEIVAVDPELVGERDRVAAPVAAIRCLPQREVDVRRAAVSSLARRGDGAQQLPLRNSLTRGKSCRQIRVEVSDRVSIAEID